MKHINCILLIDDNPADNAYHSIMIEEAGVCNEIKVVMTATEGLTYLKGSSPTGTTTTTPTPDLIFLDINLPGMNGFDFLEEYKQLPEEVKSKAIIIMLTTSLNPDDHTRSVSFKEVSDFLNKPLTVEGVQQAVEKFF